VYGHEVEIVAAEEGAAYGAALLAGVGAGVWKSVDAACDAVVKVAKRVKPNKDSKTVMEKQYVAYRRMYPALKKIYP
jgi:xylulokinase